jgi:hypothetical protein
MGSLGNRRKAVTDDQIEELAKQHHVRPGMRPPPQMVKLSEDTLGFRRPDGFTLFGASLLEFARAIEAAERERCAKVCDQEVERCDKHYNPDGKEMAERLAEAIRKGE